MKFGLDKNTRQRLEPKSGVHAICPCCDEELVSKCGDIRIHHWAHKKDTHCDHWWEPETEWHRKWKDRFPSGWQETIKRNPDTGEKHIADIFNKDMGLVIEFQNSPIDLKEMRAREQFYQKMLWIVNAEKFDFHTSSTDKKNPKLEKKLKQEALKLPRMPDDVYKQKKEYEDQLQLINMAVSYGEMTNGEANDKKEKIKVHLERITSSYYHYEFDTSNWYRQELDKFDRQNQKRSPSDSFVQYTWNRRRKTWDSATAPVFFDLGHEVVLLKSSFIALRVPLDKLLKKYGQTESSD